MRNQGAYRILFQDVKASICVELDEPNSHISTFKLMFADHGYGCNVGWNYKLCAVLAASSRVTDQNKKEEQEEDGVHLLLEKTLFMFHIALLILIAITFGIFVPFSEAYCSKYLL